MEASALEGSLSMEQKRQLIYEVSKWPEGALEMLQAWSRQEILQVLCAELGKERKYTGLTKSKLIENLLKIVCGKRSQEPGTIDASKLQPSSENSERTPKRQRKSDHPNHLLVGAAVVTSDVDSVNNNTMCCKNSACKAKLNHDDVFCKRCSCCICHQYDDNKDPSLWLICNSDPPFCGLSCGMSCHLECALRHENSGISQDRQDKGLDGSFCCVSCGKVNDLLSSWKKQLVVAKDTRRVDILCYRLSLSQKILSGTKHYQHLFGIIDEAVKKLEEDVGPLTGLPVKKARGIVNRLSSGPEIQRLCASALESLDFMLFDSVSDMSSGCNILRPELVRFEDISASSLMVILNSDNSNMGNIDGYTLWHRRAGDADYPGEPTCRLFKPNDKFLLSGLLPATQYALKVIALDMDREAGFCELRFQTRYQVPKSKISEVERSESPVTTNCSSLSNPSSIEDETNNAVPDRSRKEATMAARDIISLLHEEYSVMKTGCGPLEAGPLANDGNKELSDGQMVDDTSTGNGSNTPPRTSLECLECVPYVDSSEAGLPVTPCKFENAKDDAGRASRPKFGGKGAEREAEPQAGSSSKKRNGESRDEKCTGIGDKDFEYYVKVIRWLECEGHMETGFRQKFLTWYSLRATPQEVRVVKVFIDTFVEDPESLAGQLLHSFSHIVSDKRCLTVPAGFCTKLWH